MKRLVIASLFLLAVLSGCINREVLPNQEITSGQTTKSIDTITYSLNLPETIFSNGTSKSLNNKGTFEFYSIYHLFTTPDKQYNFMVEVLNDTKTLEETLTEKSQELGTLDEAKKIVFKGKDAVRLDRQYTIASTTFPIAPTKVAEQKTIGITFPNACRRYVTFWCTTPLNQTINFCDSVFESLDFECRK
jgi:hypothetical protein